MTRTNKIIIGIIIVIIVIAGIWYGLTRKPAEKEPIKIGFIGAVTGNFAAIADPIKKAVVLAAEEINNSGSIKGRQIEMIYEDGKCNGKDAASAAQKLITIDGVKIIIGGLCSGETLGAAPIAETAKVILFSPGSGSPDITNAGDYIFRNFPSDASSGKKMAEIAIQKNLKKVAILAENADYSQAVKKVFLNRFKELGGTIVSEESFSSQAIDLRTPITKIKSSHPEAIYLIPNSVITAEIAIKQFHELGLNMQLLTNDVVTTGDTLKNLGSLLEGVLFAEPAFDENKPQTKEFLDKYQKKYGSISVPPVYLATAYDAVYILKEMIEKYGTDTEKIKSGLYSIKNREGTAGILTIDANGDAILEYTIKTIKSGKVVPYEE